MEKNLLQTPDWDRLFDIAAENGGYFGTRHCTRTGYSASRLRDILHARQSEMVGRSVYRAVQIPERVLQDLMEHWLWSGLAGIFSHDTALALHDLSERLSTRIHMTLPLSWKAQKLTAPKGVVLHYARIGKPFRRWNTHVPTTAPYRAILDCIEAGRGPDVLNFAITRAMAHGKISREQANGLDRLIADIDESSAL
jgi:predicted transcriptional regulator of viral defense system